MVWSSQEVEERLPMSGYGLMENYDPIMTNIATALVVVLPVAIILVLFVVQRALRDTKKVTNARDKANG